MAVPGRIIVNTGNGKGKTTAALGTAFRALGYGRKVCVVQFIKGQGTYGERLLAASLENIDWHICGKGFVFSKENIEEDRQIAREGFDLARSLIEEDRYDLMILDELTYLPAYDFIPIDEVVEMVKNKPERLTIIVTGRNADEKLIEIADTVTEMVVLKHAFDAGVKAQKGVEF